MSLLERDVIKSASNVKSAAHVSRLNSSKELYFKEPNISDDSTSNGSVHTSGVNLSTMMIAFAGAAGGTIAIGEDFQSAIIFGTVVTGALKAFDLWARSIE